jgi:hypothetical protein
MGHSPEIHLMALALLSGCMANIVLVTVVQFEHLGDSEQNKFGRTVTAIHFRVLCLPLLLHKGVKLGIFH